MSRSGRRVLAGAALLAAVLSFSACSRVETNAGGLAGGSHPWTVHGVLRVGSYEDLDSLNPLM